VQNYANDKRAAGAKLELFVSGMTMSGFMPHGMCFLWTPWILWTHVSSDAIIGLSYFSIPFVLGLFALKRPDVRYRPTLYLFMAFILLCGATHFMALAVIWHPLYEIQGVLKAVTAAVSLLTAIMLWPLLPKALALPSTAQLLAKNTELSDEVERRRIAEVELTAVARSLETRSKELTQSNEALRQYTAVASHDLQSPLRHITMLAQLLEEEASDELSPQGREIIGNIVNGTQRMQRIIESLLEYSTLVERELVRKPVDLEAVARESVKGLARDIKDAKADIHLDMVPVKVAGDAKILSRLFDNLIGNSLKYRSEAPPRIRITSVADGDQLEVSVTDNGIGVPNAYADRIFEMLRRLHRENEIPGTGIGLSLCQRIVESHGGEIWLDKTYSKGARFCFTLPISKPE
jgi:signal transduction histidine kinase